MESDGVKQFVFVADQMTEAAASQNLLSFWFYKFQRNTRRSLKFSYRHRKRNTEPITDGFCICTG